ncbi:gp417 [Bacillus phage G]|uniref:Gp417 n=1 Tax=Bacillus phage G TaxID=2884420 RepID=G3MAF8_9CAUD|nr:gp417 [Bacillus phage G]AEO93675.1 gp417 [Bacillus phage G]
MANKQNEYVASEKLHIPGLESTMQSLKMEIATELGMPDYENMDKGELSSRQNGYVGGQMTKRLVRMAQETLAENYNKNKLN